MTPLHIASLKGDEKNVELLLKEGAKINAVEQVFLFIFFFNLFSMMFSLSHFSIFFFYVKDGATPLYIAAQEGHEQIVQLLLEKGKPNVDLANKVILLIISFSFSLSHFSNFFIQKGRQNSSLYCCCKGT